MDIYKAVETGARARGFKVIMANTDYRSERLMASVRLMIGHRVAGLAAIVSGMDPELTKDLSGYGIPVVYCDAGAQRDNIANIRVNYRGGMDKLTDYLRGLGHRRMGVVGNHGMLRPVDERVSLVLESLARYPDMEVQTAVDTDSPEGGSRATRALLFAHPELTAIVFVNDFMAVGAMHEIRERGLRVPEDVSVTGFDDVALAEYWYPALTSAHISRDQIGQRICDALVSDKGKMPTWEMLIDPELVLRNSTGPAAKS